MRAALVLVVAFACDAGEKSPPKRTPVPDPVTTQSKDAAQPVKAEPYVIHYDCFHSDMPFGDGSQYRNLTVDLGAKTRTLDAWELTGHENDKPPEPPDYGPPKVEHHPEVSPLGPEWIARIETAVAAVLRGGPFKPEFPVPEGTPCDLVIELNGKKLFELEKAYTKENDAATRLVEALAP
jgi:hypothetical protein